VLTFNGLIIIQGKVTLNVHTGYHWPASEDDEEDS